MIRLVMTLETPERTTPRQITIDRFPFEVGRATTTDLTVLSSSISGRHFVLGHDEQGFTITDLGSTNGTLIGGELIEAHRPQRITTPITVITGHVRIFLEAPDAGEPGFTLAESSTRLQEIVADIMGECQEVISTRPFLEILKGPRAGERFPLDIDGDDISVGTSEEDSLRITEAEPSQPSDASEQRATVFWRDGRCWIRPELGCLRLGQTTLTDERRMESGDRYFLGCEEILFFDPLEEEMAIFETPQEPTEEPPEEGPPPTLPVTHAPPPEALSAPEASWNPMELGLMAMSVVFLIATVAILWVFLVA